MSYLSDISDKYDISLLSTTNTPWWWWPSDQCAFTRLKDTVRTKIVHHSLFNGYTIDEKHESITCISSAFLIMFI